MLSVELVVEQACNESAATTRQALASSLPLRNRMMEEVVMVLPEI